MPTPRRSRPLASLAIFSRAPRLKVWGLDGTRYAGEDLDLDVTLLANETGVREARGIAVTADFSPRAVG